MSLFQSIIIEKYVRELDNTQLETAWQTYSHCFLNLSKQDNIRLSKEEQYQEGFLRDLFVDVFGYTLNPNPDYDITTEFKNQTGSKKADGAILKDGHAIGVIELKGMNTTDLSKIEQQAFGYKNNQPKCRYVITSNFQKLRLYIDNAVEFIEFNLFTLTQDDFALLYLLLHRDGIMGDLPAKLKSASLSQEEAITKQLYKDYSVFKRELFNDLTTNNPSVDNLVLFQKSQKLLDRLLFIFFAEDSHLLPANFAKGIISEWEQLKSLKMTVPLYDRVKAYFGYLDKGHKDEHSEIFAYNGGLFSTDELLDSVIISDNILYTHIKILSEYDFDSEVDVNILGHIFENSLSELDEVKAQLEGTAVDKSQTKRKKDGVFYTPKYITKYIVENTVGKLCTDKKLELGINEEDYQQEAVINKDGTKRKKTDKQIAKEKVAFDNLNAYRDWLLQITICDPAVGSGAFLNEALNFLIAEHEYIVELETKLFGSGLAYPDIENSILENNLFGVDINEESVEIAKLSLWLRTAQPRRKLNNLNDNIKCGNSLIDDPAIAGDKAFNWQTAFPQVFAKGGFDVVIGNPPYVDIKALDSKITKYLFLNYETSNNRINLYSVFIEKSTELLKKQGYLSFIIPSSLLTQDSYKILREHILENTTIEKIVRLPNESFGGGSGEVKVDTIILAFRNSKYKANTEVVIYKGFDRITEIVGVLADVNFFIDANQWLEDPEKVFRINVDNSITELLGKCRKDSKKLIECVDFCLGLTPYDKYKGHSQEQIKGRVFHSEFKKDETFKKLLAGNDITRYNVSWGGKEWISYGDWLGASREKKFFTDKRILVKQIIDWSDKRIWSALTQEELYNTQNAFNLLPFEDFEAEYIISIINSKLMSFYHKKQFLEEYKDRFQKILIKDAKEFPIKDISLEEQKKYKVVVDNITVKIKNKVEMINSFSKFCENTTDIEKLSRKLENWHELSFSDFLKELTKAIKATNKIRAKEGQSPIAELTRTVEFEWMELFESKKQKVLDLQEQIQQTEQEIDQMVYKLYDLTDDEIAIIEAS